jgi:Uncharacterized protein conserved in bacteria
MHNIKLIRVLGKMSFKILILSLFFIDFNVFAQMPKREFRGGWIHIVGNDTIKNKTKKEVQQMFLKVLDAMEQVKCNAVIFQVRPCADAFYYSELEPWSRYLSGKQGVPPKELWDPLEFMIEESHKRGMEIHAWCNPYRVTLKDTDTLCKNHVYFKHKSIFVKYGEQIYFNPAEPLSREYTVKAVADIVRRYNIDAIHFDDYFYPYPIKGEEFDDDYSFKKYAKKQGFAVLKKGKFSSGREYEYHKKQVKGDWRRYNVELLIKELNDTIKSIKPWVRFGISPFGIHRNKKDTPDGSGSNTNGLSNYDELFADVPKWVEKGYIDYYVPQLYWKIGHKAADYKTLINWWNDSWVRGQLYIGQSISTFNEKDLKNPKQRQTKEKINLQRKLKNVKGNVWWPAWSLVDNTANVKEDLQKVYQKNFALIPPYKEIDNIPPKAVAQFKKNGRNIVWEQSLEDKENPMQKALFYAVYCFPDKAETNINNSKYLLKITQNTTFNVIEENPNHKAGCRYVVTVIDRCWNESIPSKMLWF